MTKKPQQLPTLDLIEKYHEETQQQYTQVEKHAAAVNEAQALVNALNYRYEDAVKAAVLDGKDNSKQLEEINDQLAAAERKLSNAKRMQQVARSINKRTVSKQDVERELRAYENMYQTDIIAPSEKELRKAKEAYIVAFLEHSRKIEHFNEQAHSAFYTVNPNYGGYSVPYEVGFKTSDNRKNKTLSIHDLDELERGLQPKSLQPLRKAVKDEKTGHTIYVPIEEGENN